MKWAKKWVQIWTHHNFITFSYKCDPLLTSKFNRISVSYKRNLQNSVFITLWWNCEVNGIHVFSAISHFHDIFITMLGKWGLLNFVRKTYFTNSWHFYHNVRKIYFVMKMWHQIGCRLKSVQHKNCTIVIKMWWKCDIGWENKHKFKLIFVLFNNTITFQREQNLKVTFLPAAVARRSISAPCSILLH